MYIIRECRIDDYIDIYELNKNEMGYDYPLEQQREKILQLIESPNDKIYVAVAKEKVIGYTIERHFIRSSISQINQNI